jgi:hypothetical protein
MEYIEDNEIVLETHANPEGIPWKVVKSKKEERRIFHGDVHHFLKTDLFAAKDDSEIEALYAKLQPLLEEAYRKRMENYKPPNFDRIVIPNVKKQFPSIREILVNNPIMEKPK